jgi:hypothetical protein
VYPHRVDVLHVTDDDTGVVGVPHHLVLEFDPPRYRLGDEHLAVAREPEPLPNALDELLEVVDDAGAGATERVRRPRDDRQSPDSVDGRLDAVAERRLVEVGHGFVVVQRDGRRLRNRLSDGLHPLSEEVTVLGRVDRLERRPHDLDVVFFENPLLGQLGGDV